MLLSPSILAADLIDLKSTLKMIEPLVDFVHIDVMDGHFVPTLSFGEMYTKAVAQNTTLPLDVHLMVSRPEIEVPKYFEIRPANLTFHVEATNFAVRLANHIREQGIKAGVSLNPQTSISSIECMLDHIDLVLIMSVEPGFYGQSFLPLALNKIRDLKKMIGNRPITIEVDGGIGSSNLRQIIDAGADMIVAGSAVFQGGTDEKIKQNIAALRSLA